MSMFKRPEENAILDKGLSEFHYNDPDFQVQPEEYKVYQPWSNFILHTRLPEPIYNRLLEITDKVFATPNPDNLMGSRLAGQLIEEYEINDQIKQEEGLNAYFLEVAFEYIRRSRRQCHPISKEEDLNREKFRIAMRSIWVNKQLPGDYNPAHTHSNCELSGVIYLKLPNKLPPKKKHEIFTQMRDPDGAIVFINNTGTDDTFSEGILEYQPKLGDFFLFGAGQKHMVHPYRSNDPTTERRSIALNLAVDMVDTSVPINEKKRLKRDMKISKKQTGFPYNLIVDAPKKGD